LHNIPTLRVRYFSVPSANTIGYITASRQRTRVTIILEYYSTEITRIVINKSVPQTLIIKPDRDTRFYLRLTIYSISIEKRRQLSPNLARRIRLYIAPLLEREFIHLQFQMHY